MVAMNKKIVFLLILINCNATETLQTHISLDLSKIYYSTKKESKETHLRVDKILKAMDCTSNEIALQNILAFAQSKKINCIDIPRSIIPSPAQLLCASVLDYAKITVTDPNWNYSLVAYPPCNVSFADELFFYSEQDYIINCIRPTEELMYRIFAIDNDNDIIGVSKLLYHSLYADSSEIDHLYVCSEYRKKNIGTHLISFSKELSAARKKDVIRLYACPFGENATDKNTLQKWYKKHGFSLNAPHSSNMHAAISIKYQCTQLVSLDLSNSNDINRSTDQK